MCQISFKNCIIYWFFKKDKKFPFKNKEFAKAKSKTINDSRQCFHANLEQLAELFVKTFYVHNKI